MSECEDDDCRVPEVQHVGQCVAPLPGVALPTDVAVDADAEAPAPCCAGAAGAATTAESCSGHRGRIMSRHASALASAVGGGAGVVDGESRFITPRISGPGMRWCGCATCTGAGDPPASLACGGASTAAALAAVCGGASTTTTVAGVGVDVGAPASGLMPPWPGTPGATSPLAAMGRVC